jgi:hypothetical protein
MPVVVALVALTLGTVARIVALTTDIARFESDEAVTGIMAKGILDGDLPAYFGTQSYQGALEQYLQAAVFAVFPDTPLTLRLVQVVLTIVIGVLVYLLARRMIGSRWAAALATALYALGPYYSVIKGVRSHGGYDTATLFGLLAVLIALRLRRDSRHALWLAAAMGVSAGLAIWANYLAFYLLIPAALWALGSARGSLRRLLPAGVAGLAVGLAPLIAYRATQGINPPSGSGEPPLTTFAQRMDLLFNPVLGKFLGVPSPDPTVANYVPAALVVFIALGALGAGIWIRRWGIWDTLTLRTLRRRPIDIVLLAFIITPFIYAWSTYTFFAGEPRYLFTLYPFLAIGITAAIFAFSGTPRLLLAIAAVALSATLLATNMKAVHDAGGEISAADGGLVHTEDLPDVVAVLQAKGATSAYADYWVANPLQFFADDALSIASTGVDHFPSVSARVDRDPSPAIVSTVPGGADAMRAALVTSGRTFTETAVGRFVVFTDIRPPWRRPSAR